MPMVTNPIVQKQYDIFDAIFEENTPVRAKYREKLAYISSSLRASTVSDDNKGEKKTYETFDKQFSKE
jgi:hypothetical protein